MKRRWALLLLLPCLRAEAQRVTELGPQAVVLEARRTFAGAGVVVARRVSERLRLSAGAFGGAGSGEAAARGELLGNLLLFPRRAGGLSPYLLGGVGAEAGPQERGYLILGLGLEAAPGRSQGWVLEAGVGGGLRVAVGYRWRLFPSGWVPET